MNVKITSYLLSPSHCLTLKWLGHFIQNWFEQLSVSIFEITYFHELDSITWTNVDLPSTRSPSIITWILKISILKWLKFHIYKFARKSQPHLTGDNDLNSDDQIHNYCQTSSISGTLVGNKLVDHSDVAGALPIGTAPAISSFSI